MSEESTLSEQCVQGEGVVQVNLEMKLVQNEYRINITDVIKPLEASNEEQCLLGSEIDPFGSKDFEVIESETGLIFNENEVIASNDRLLADTNSGKKILKPQSTAVTNAASADLQLEEKMQVTTNENITRWVMDCNFKNQQEKLKIPAGKKF